MSDRPGALLLPMTPEPPEHRGDRPDRRRRDLPVWHPRRLHGRRRRARRLAEHDGPYLVDRCPRLTSVLAALILVLTLTDGALTVELLDRGCEEANPFMRLLLDHSPAAFLVGKYALTAAFLPLAVVMNQYPLLGTRFRVGHLVPAVAALYLVLVAYQVRLWVTLP